MQPKSLPTGEEQATDIDATQKLARQSHFITTTGRSNVRTIINQWI